MDRLSSIRGLTFFFFGFAGPKSRSCTISPIVIESAAHENDRDQILLVGCCDRTFRDRM